MNKKTKGFRNCIIAVVLLAGAAIFGYQAMFDSYRPVKAAVGGQVTWTADEGTVVQEGTAILKISTPTGEITAARAMGDGQLHSLKVKIGDSISAGQVVADIK